MVCESTLTVSVSAELGRFVQEQIRTGRYRDSDDVLRAALVMLREIDREPPDISGEELRRLIAVGLAQAERGELIDGDEAFAARRERRAARLGTECNRTA